ncbi:TldD/PmbA family protein [Natranaerofaba carboxydovora]|uniref:TldD/PmbA family protein n=1 Tax=Natranaerofaba carboxydovora TaxID=2742683 RepID=UPI001F13F940|nr:TldD/PmbA family protein [Natranaerofaba carboxydovora]UMZ74857.1 Metalloprotease PmbA [Natranaerofaba carboxydovora]
MDDIIKKAKEKGEEAELFQVTHKTTPVEFENNRLKNIKTQELNSYALRLIKDGRLGFSTSTKEDNPEELLEKARQSSTFGRNFEPNLPENDPVELKDMYDPKVQEVPLEKLIELGTELVDTMKNKNSDVLAQAEVEKAETKITIKNTRGFDNSYTKSSFTIMGGAMLMVGKSFLTFGSFKSLPNYDPDTAEIKEELLQDLEFGPKEVDITSGNYDVIISPSAMGDVFRPIIASIDGQAVEKKMSPFRDKLEQKLFDDRVSLIDMPHKPWTPGMCPFDDEGTLTKETPFIKEGTLLNFPLDLLTANSLKMEPTGHAVRSALSLPSPGLHNAVLEPGETELKDMIKSIDKGVYVKDLMGAWAGNPYGGEVNGNISLGYLIENGEIVGRIKDCMFSCNTFEVLKDQLVDFSKESKWMGSISYPYAQLEGVSITAKG